MKKFTAFIIVLVALGLLYNFYLKDKLGEKNFEYTSQTYENTTFDVVDDWQKLTYSTGSIAYNDDYASLAIAYTDYTGTLDTYMNFMKQLITTGKATTASGTTQYQSSARSNFKLIDTEYVTIDDKKSGRIEFTFDMTLNDETNNFTEITYCTIVDSKLYLWDFTIISDEYYTYQPVIEHIVSSIKFS